MTQRNTKFDTPEWIHRPEFAYVRPDPYPGARDKNRKKDSKPNMVPDVLVSFNDTALLKIHDHPRSEDAQLAIFIFNHIAFDFERFGTSAVKANKMLFGQVMKKCLDVGYEFNEVSATIRSLLERKALTIKGGLKLTCYPLLGLEPSYAADYAERYIEWSAAQSEKPANVAEQKVFRTPNFIKEDRYAIPEKAEGQLMWRRRIQMERDAAVGLQRHELLKIHPEPESDTGKNAVHLFNLVAFGSHSLTDVLDDPSYVKANRISYSAILKHIMPLRSIPREEIDEHLLSMLNKGVLHVERARSDFFLTANKFLDNVAIVEPVPEPVPPRDLYAELTEREGEDMRILTPPELTIAEYQRPPPLAGSSIWSHSKPPGANDVSTYFADESLAKIHPQLDSDIGQLCLHLYNIIAFGSSYLGSPIDKFAYGTLVRVMHNENVPFESFTEAINGLFERKALTMYTREEGSSNNISAYPLLATARLRIEPKVTDRSANKLRYRHKRGLITSEEFEQEKRRKKELRESIRTVPENVIIGDETHCVGFPDVPCTHGEDGAPRAVDKDDWSIHFYLTKKSNFSPARRAKTCKKCENDRRAKKKEFEFSFSNGGHHFDSSIGRPVWRSWATKLLEKSDCCALCGGEFVFQRTNHPWQPSFNIKLPARNILIMSFEQAEQVANIVHQACNMAQNDTDFDDMEQICRFIARHADIGRENERQPLILNQKHFAMVHNTGREAHCLTPDKSREICRLTLFQRDLMTGITIGYGSDFAIDLSNDQTPELLLPSLDRINCDPTFPDVDNVSNFRVILRLFNFLTKNYPDKDEVVRIWIERIKQKYL